MKMEKPQLSKEPVIGVLSLSSKVILGFNKRNIPRKQFIPLNSNLIYSVASKKPLQSSDYYAVINPDKWKENEKYPFGNLEILIGPVGDYDAELECLKRKYNIHWKRWKTLDFSEYSIDLTPDRKDFTELYTFSIDPEGCKDIDDCLHIRKIGDTIEIGVHIADVSSYIPEGSVIDKEIRKRGQSVYLTCEQVNMLPDEMSTGTISLLEGQKRRTFSVIFTIDSIGGTIVEFHKSWIVNKKAMTYEEANKSMDGDIYNLYVLGKQFYEDSERMFVEEYDIHKMVEVYMVMANSAVAEFLYQNAPEQTILRTHTASGEINETDYGSSFQEPENLSLPRTARRREDEGPLKEVTKLINVMKQDKAEYQLNPEETRHKGLGLDFYTHFTSPIRRYLDIVVHRQLYALLENKEMPVIDDKLCNDLNKYQKNIKQAERESEIFNIVYNLYEEGSEMKTVGYIASIYKSTIGIYVPEYKTVITCYPFHNKIKEMIIYESNEEKMVLFNKDRTSSVEFNLLDKVDIQVVVSMKTPDLKKKILIKILDETYETIMKEY